MTFGDNSRGQCGVLSSLAYIDSPSLVPSLLGLMITAVSCGAAHTVALTSDGRAYSWGVGCSGQLGTGVFDVVSQATRVDTEKVVTAGRGFFIVLGHLSLSLSLSSFLLLIFSP